jgi:hypothetical protein
MASRREGAKGGRQESMGLKTKRKRRLVGPGCLHSCIRPYRFHDHVSLRGCGEFVLARRVTQASLNWSGEI